jgi:membrane-associated phospholipid phosphatase
MIAFLFLVNIFGFYWLEHFLKNSLLNLLFIILAITLININFKWNESADGGRRIPNWIRKTFLIARYFYLGFAILLIYSQFQVLIKTFHPIDYDILLNNWDLALLGMRAGDLMRMFSFPIFTEFLQIAYSSFYFLPAIVGYQIWKMHRENFDTFARNIIFTFFFSYFLYFFFPAIGPRFAVYDFSALNMELPGIYLTNFLREAINYGGGVIHKNVDPASIVNRDCMPSGHTMITLVNIFWAFRYKVKSRYFILIFGVSIIIATVYMRYHYLVDILAGIFFAYIALLLEPIFHKYFTRIIKKSK